MTRPVGEIMGEIAYLNFVVRKMYEDSKSARSPIHMLVDEACGMPKLKLKKAKLIIARINKLQKLLDL